MKKINNNFQCVNVATETYTGKEMSPKGFGYSAMGYPVGYEKEGVDKLIWIVQVNNNKKVWFRKNNITKITHEEPLLTDNLNTNEPEINNEKIITNPEQNETQNIEEKQEKKITDYNYFYKYYSNKLKTENKDKNLKKSNKDIQTEIFNEWHRLKIKENKIELDNLIEIIKNTYK